MNWRRGLLRAWLVVSICWAYAGLGARRSTFMGPASANLHTCGRSRLIQLPTDNTITPSRCVASLKLALFGNFTSVVCTGRASPSGSMDCLSWSHGTHPPFSTRPLRATRAPGDCDQRNRKSAERNIEAGNNYRRYLITTYINDPGIHARNQTLFAFGAYNAAHENPEKVPPRRKTWGPIKSTSGSAISRMPRPRSSIVKPFSMSEISTNTASYR
jgi:hypothetical protein